MDGLLTYAWFRVRGQSGLELPQGDRVWDVLFVADSYLHRGHYCLSVVRWVRSQLDGHSVQT